MLTRGTVNSDFRGATYREVIGIIITSCIKKRHPIICLELAIGVLVLPGQFGLNPYDSGFLHQTILLLF